MATRYIDADSGTDAGAGGIGAPWKTFAYAYTNCTEGDTLYFLNSTAHFDWPIGAGFGFNMGKNLTLQGEFLGGAIIDAANAACGLVVDSNKTINIYDLMFTGVNKGVTYYPISIFGGYHASSNAIFNMTRCIIYNNIVNYNGLFSSSTGPSISANFTFNLNSVLVYDIWSSGSGAPGFLYNDTSYLSTTVRDCTWYAPKTGGTKLPYCIANGAGNITNLTITNTIISGEESSLLYLYDAGAYSVGATAFANSCIHNFTCTLMTNRYGGAITSDPLLVDPLNGNLKLRPNSPCIGTGTII